MEEEIADFLHRCEIPMIYDIIDLRNTVRIISNAPEWFWEKYDLNDYNCAYRKNFGEFLIWIFAVIHNGE